MAVEFDWSVRDLLCTATHFLAQAIAQARARRLPEDAAVDEVVVTGGGQFNGMSARVIKSISQGSHKVELSYEFQGETGPRVTKAKVLEKGKEDTLYAVEYKYGQDGRLCKVISPIGHEIGIKYDEERVIVGRR